MVKGTNFEIKAVDKFEGGGDDSKQYEAHDEAQTKNKVWVVVKGGATHSEAFDTLKNAAPGCLASQFANGVFTLVKKEYTPNLAVPDGFTSLSPVEKNKKLTVGKTPGLVKLFKEVPHTANYNLFEATNKTLPAFEEVVDELIVMTEKEFTSWMGDARIAKRDKKQTPLQEAALASVSELKDRIRMNEIGCQMMVPVGSQGFRYPEDFLSDVPGMMGYYFDIHTETIKQISWDDCNFETDMHLRNLVVVIGMRGGGKSQLVKATASKQADMYDFDKFAFGKIFDPFGCSTKSGAIMQCGSFAWADCEMVTLRENSPFTTAELKAFSKVDEPGQYRARHYPASLPAGVPRLVAVNMGEGNDHGKWFRENRMYACECLANNDLTGLLGSSDDMQAMARNCTVFPIGKRFLYKPDDTKKSADPISSKFANRKKLK